METFFTLLNIFVSLAEAIWHTLPQNAYDILFATGLFFCGALASFINMLSGGGSMIVLGFMMLCGVDPVVANATNRAGVLISVATGAAAYKSERFTDVKESLKLGLWTIPGAIIGAVFSIQLDGELYQKILAVVMIIIVAGMLFPSRSDSSTGEQKKDMGQMGKWTYPAMLLVGFYGGAIQVGVGIIIFAALHHLGRMSLMRINMHRIFIVLIFIIPSMAVFIWSGKINWVYAAALCAGNALGAWITAKWTIKKGDRLIRLGMVISVVLMSAKFLIF